MRLRPALGLAALVALSACSSSGPPGYSAPAPTTPAPASASPTAAPSAVASGTQLTIQGFAYSALTVIPGTTIRVANLDQAEHTATSDTAGLFDADVPGGGSGSLTAPTKAGTYTYHCTFHGSMHGTLTVR